MANQSDKIQEILLKLEELKGQIGRILSDIESEKGTRKILHEDFDRRLRSQEEWKSKVEGTWIVLKVIVGFYPL